MGNRKRIRIRKGRLVIFLLVTATFIAAIVMAVYIHITNQPTELREAVSEIDGIPVITDFVPAETQERPGEERRIRYIVIHETGNAGRNADAASHNNYLHEEADNQQKSWHYTVDSNEIYYHIPDNEIAFHAGDGLARDGGNMSGIGIEMCINPENDYEQTLKNTAKLTAMLLSAYDLSIDSVRKHEDFSGKHCPDLLLNAGRWDEFVNLVEQELKIYK